MERETGIEPATNSLEGCDSTTELLPPPIWETGNWKPENANWELAPQVYCQPSGFYFPSFQFLIPSFQLPIPNWWTGEDSNLRRPHGPADLQSAAFDRSATCPISHLSEFALSEDGTERARRLPRNAPSLGERP